MIREVWKQAINRFHSQGEKQFRKGMSKYGVPLATFNGRDPFTDALEEAVDLSQYLEQARLESESIANVFYIYAITEGFFGQLPEHIQDYLDKKTEGKSIAQLCMEENIEFYGTVKPYGSKIL